jgi:hypothetical protein
LRQNGEKGYNDYKQVGYKASHSLRMIYTLKKEIFNGRQRRQEGQKQGRQAKERTRTKEKGTAKEQASNQETCLKLLNGFASKRHL